MNEKGSNLPIVRQRNYFLIKKIIYQQSPISRSEIAQRLSLTAPTITASVNPLISKGLIREFPAPATSSDGKVLGRRPIMLEFVPDAYYVCGIELGPYQTSFVITDICGKVVASQQIDYKSQGYTLESYEETLDLMEAEIPAFIQRSGISEEQLLAVGVGLPGLVNGTTGKIHNTFRRSWIGHDLASDLAQRLHTHVKIENNVRARTICADLFDRAVTADPLAYFFVSYGLSCPLIIDGKVLYGQSAASGEIGHTLVEFNGPKCDTCGNNGCLESVASEKAILKRCRTIMFSGIDTILNQLCPNPEELTITHVLKAQECDDKIANMVVKDCIRYLGVSLASIMNLISPRTVLIDAQIFSLPQNQTAMLTTVNKNIFGINSKKPNISFVPFNPFYGARGAAAIAVKEFLLEDSDD